MQPCLFKSGEENHKGVFASNVFSMVHVPIIRQILKFPIASEPMLFFGIVWLACLRCGPRICFAKRFARDTQVCSGTEMTWSEGTIGFKKHLKQCSPRRRYMFCERNIVYLLRKKHNGQIMLSPAQIRH